MMGETINMEHIKIVKLAVILEYKIIFIYHYHHPSGMGTGAKI